MQNKRVLERLRVRPLSAKDAWAELGIGRLSARIMDLRQQGHEIETMRFRGINRFGERVSYAVYRLVKEATHEHA